MRRLVAYLTRTLGVICASLGSEGEYPVERLFAFSEYSKAVTSWRVFWVLLRACLPPLLLLIVFDAMPLRDPSEGWRASGWFWVRTFANGFICAAGILVQINHFILDKPIPRAKMLGIMGDAAIGYTGSMVLLANYWAFPIPFTMTVCSPIFVVFFKGLLLLAIGTRDRVVLRKIVKFTNIVGVQTSMVLVYPSFHAVFLTLSRTSQVTFMGLLPVIKISYKLVISWISKELEDLGPAIVASVDLFDALDMTKCMQSAGAICLFRQFRALHGAHDDITQVPGASKDLLVQISTLLASKGMLRTSSLRLESHSLLVISAQARAELDRLRQMRLAEQPSSTDVVGGTIEHGPNARDIPISSAPSIRAERIGMASVVPFSEEPRMCPKHSSNNSAEKNTQLLRETMRLLHESESVVLVEYIEAVVPVFYVVYLVILFHLPNAKYYQDVSQLTAEKLQTIVTNILIYALLGFLSLLYVNEALKRNFGVSAFRQLAFTSEYEWHIFQSNFNSWIVLIFQFLLAHNGKGLLPTVYEGCSYYSEYLLTFVLVIAGSLGVVCPPGVDFTFKFAWLHSSTQPNS